MKRCSSMGWGKLARLSLTCGKRSQMSSYMDVHLRQVNGLDLLRELRKDASLKSCPGLDLFGDGAELGSLDGRRGWVYPETVYAR